MADYQYILDQARILESKGYTVTIGGKAKWVLVEGTSLPRFGIFTDENGRRIEHANLLILLPPDFPMSVPGVGGCHRHNSIHCPRLYFNGRLLADLHECSHSPWNWLCFERIVWDNRKDNLSTLVHIIEMSIIKRAQKT